VSDFRLFCCFVFGWIVLYVALLLTGAKEMPDGSFYLSCLIAGTMGVALFGRRQP